MFLCLDMDMDAAYDAETREMASARHGARGVLREGTPPLLSPLSQVRVVGSSSTKTEKEEEYAPAKSNELAAAAGDPMAAAAMAM